MRQTSNDRDNFLNGIETMQNRRELKLAKDVQTTTPIDNEPTGIPSDVVLSDIDNSIQPEEETEEASLTAENQGGIPDTVQLRDIDAGIQSEEEKIDQVASDTVNPADIDRGTDLERAEEEQLDLNQLTLQ